MKKSNLPKEEKRVKGRICEGCGQKINDEILLKHMIKNLKKCRIPYSTKALNIATASLPKVTQTKKCPQLN